MTWTTKSLDRVNEYVVIKHKLKDMNGNIAGIRFRGGYAVVAKGSKAYFTISRFPLIEKIDLPLLTLRKLPFISRTADVLQVYGKDVYNKYLEVLKPELSVEEVQREEAKYVAHTEENGRCCFITKTGDLCKWEVHELSPSKYCKSHILKDPLLPELGIVIPSRLTKDEKNEYKEKVIAKLAQLKK